MKKPLNLFHLLAEIAGMILNDKPNRQRLKIGKKPQKLCHLLQIQRRAQACENLPGLALQRPRI